MGKTFLARNIAVGHHSAMTELTGGTSIGQLDWHAQTFERCAGSASAEIDFPVGQAAHTFSVKRRSTAVPGTWEKKKKLKISSMSLKKQLAPEIV